MHSIQLSYISSSGAGVGEGDTYQRVNVHDGSTAEGTVDHMVHQTVPLSLNLLCSGHATPEGIIVHLHASMYTYTYTHVQYHAYKFLYF